MPATLLWLLRRRLGGIEGRRVAIAFVEDRGAAVVMGVGGRARGGDNWTRSCPDREKWCAAARVALDHRRRARGAGRLGTAAADRGIHRRDRARRPPPACPPAGDCRLRVPASSPSDGAVRRVRPLRRGRIRQHLRAAAAAADSPTRPVAGRGRDADDAVPAVGVGLTDRVRASRGPLAATTAADGRADCVGRSFSASSARRRRCRWPRRSWSSAASAVPPSILRPRRSPTGWAPSAPGLAMSVHITGGSLGFSMGPLLFAPFAQAYGLEWTPILAIPGSGGGPVVSEPAAARHLDDDHHAWLPGAPARTLVRWPCSTSSWCCGR